ncbi:hypothetical protein C8E08_0247 [Paracidovorax citrulli]|nr:hypothetical protein CQB05_09070 [Paracidovorax citrulli]MVT38887.1 hypothetical protein [Paracidovorax citrulli]PVY62980.1 hypothetical protein C8E08_0247 [Paracidovorax citrulli]QCX12721.1 hypothetical protein APS58_4014 [Paracidovorax citrulli]REG68037.1 hypothetical protein C8E07_1132 [Paracidovorax citrulli]
MIRKTWPFLSSYQERSDAGDTVAPAHAAPADTSSALAAAYVDAGPRIRPAHAALLGSPASQGSPSQASACAG